MAWGTHKTARFLAAIAISLQVLLQGAMAWAPSQGFDLTSLYCASPELERSPEATAALRELAVSTGLEEPGHDPHSEHCPLCVLVHGAPLQAQPRLNPPAPAPQPVCVLVFEPAFHTLALGPPLGSRAPPALT